MSKQNSNSLVSKLMKRNLREHVPRTLLFVIIVPGLPVIFQMALYNIGRNKKKNLLVIFLLTLGTLTLGSVYVIQKSFDINIYMKEIALGDFTISERTLVNTWGEYNPKKNQKQSF